MISEKNWLMSALQHMESYIALPNNWDGYDGIAPTPDLVRDVYKYLCNTGIENMAIAEVSPIAGGGIQLEWYMGARELELEFRNAGAKLYLKYDANTGITDCGELDSIVTDHIRRLLTWVSV